MVCSLCLCVGRHHFLDYNARWDKCFWREAAVMSTVCLVVRLPRWMADHSPAPWPPVTQTQLWAQPQSASRAASKHAHLCTSPTHKKHTSRSQQKSTHTHTHTEKPTSKWQHIHVYTRTYEDHTNTHTHTHYRGYTVAVSQIDRQTGNCCDWCSFAFNPH